jgi:hypothetical protein
MKAYFLSYSHSDSQLADITEKAFKTHGVRVWRDKHDLAPGQRFGDTIQKAIKEQCGGLIVIVTLQSLHSGFISNIELPEAHSAQLPIIPLFFGVPIEEVKRLSPKAIGFDLTAFQGANVLPSPESEDEAAIRQRVSEVAWKTLRELLKQRKAKGRTGPLRVALHSRQYVADEEADIDLDWTGYFQSALPSTEVWSEMLLPSLVRVKRAITESGLGTPELFLPFGVHLSIGLAFGFVFLQQTRFHLAIQQYSQVWSTRADPAIYQTVPSLVYDRERADVDDPRSGEAALGVGIVQAQSVRRALDGVSGVRLKRNLVLPSDISSVPDGTHALCWAKQIVDAIDELRAGPGIKIVRLYPAMPFGMAVMLGWLLNARGLIQVYEWDKGTGEYRSACRLSG